MTRSTELALNSMLVYLLNPIYCVCVLLCIFEGVLYWKRCHWLIDLLMAANGDRILHHG